MNETLTPGQEKTYQQLVDITRIFPVVVMYGEKESGKGLIVRKFLQGKNYRVIDLCDLSLTPDKPLQPSNFYHHLLETGDAQWIYIRHWDKIREIIEDYPLDYRYFPRYALSQFGDKMRLGEKQMIITLDSANSFVDNNNYWVIKHEVGVEDLSFILTQASFSQEEIKILLPLAKKIRLGQLKQVIRYVQAFSQEERINRFQEGVLRLCGSQLDPEATVTETVPEVNLIGMESILKEIEVSIIKPMSYSLDEIPIKKGVILAGPPGTGKTSIGRWLAYRLRGKLYLVDGTSNDLITNVNETLARAYRNAPAIVFIDDVDHLFDHPDIFRTFLTLLDGLENKNRGGVCMIVTCMDITKIPSALIRGGRLELCLETHLPDEEVRQRIIKLGFDKMIRLVTRLEREGRIEPVVGKLQEEVSREVITWLGVHTTGWNCADIQRCLDDILRMILSGGFSGIKAVAREVIDKIKRQYELVRRHEEVADISLMYS